MVRDFCFEEWDINSFLCLIVIWQAPAVAEWRRLRVVMRGGSTYALGLRQCDLLSKQCDTCAPPILCRDEAHAEGDEDEAGCLVERRARVLALLER